MSVQTDKDTSHRDKAAKTALSRRGFLLGATATAALAATVGSQTQTAKASVKTKAEIIIVGSGLGGIAMANRLSRQLDGARITILDKKEEHNYQPGYTLVATGIWPEQKIRNRNAEYLPSGIRWVKDNAAEFDPESNTVVTTAGEKLRYDFLIVAVGTHQDWALIEGFDTQAIGRNGLTSVYPSADAAVATWSAMDAFRKTGGNAVLTLPATPLKCAGAPLKMTFMLRDRLAQAGKLKNASVQFYSALPSTIFGVKAVNDDVVARWQDLGIGIDYGHNLNGVDIAGRKARFRLADGTERMVDYDFLHVAPPMRAPDAVKNSALAVSEGPMAAGGWLAVNKDTLQHLRYPNVFGIGDINGTARGKTAATVKKAAPLVAQHVVDVIEGRPPSQVFDGYTSCPLIVREGAAMLIEFDYAGNFVPSLPMIDPMQAGFFPWLMKVQLLKPAYVAVMKGRV
jgi:sulfide:quinone oxidoreductase